MTTVLLIIHLMIAAALVGVVLLQRSEGGALGIGGGGGFMTGRGAANFLTRVTASLAAAFFATSLLLTLLASRSTAPGSLFDRYRSARERSSGARRHAFAGPAGGARRPRRHPRPAAAARPERSKRTAIKVAFSAVAAAPTQRS